MATGGKLHGILALTFFVGAASAEVPRAPLAPCMRGIVSLAQNGWEPVERVGLLGKERDAFHREMDERYGAGNWELRQVHRGKILTKAEALQLYEDSYVAFFEKNPTILEDLLHRAKDVYDTAPSNVESGTDYGKQETASTHLQDIAVRRAVQRLGRRFEGKALLQMRGPGTPLYHLTPGFIPFVDPEAIVTAPRLYTADWIHPLSAEDFWQNNKLLVVRRP